MLVASLALATFVLGSQLASASPTPEAASKLGAIVFDGRVPITAKLADFDDASKSLYSSGYVKGQSASLDRLFR